MLRLPSVCFRITRVPQNPLKAQGANLDLQGMMGKLDGIPYNEEARNVGSWERRSHTASCSKECSSSDVEASTESSLLSKAPPPMLVTSAHTCCRCARHHGAGAGEQVKILDGIQFLTLVGDSTASELLFETANGTVPARWKDSSDMLASLCGGGP